MGEIPSKRTAARKARASHTARRSLHGVLDVRHQVDEVFATRGKGRSLLGDGSPCRGRLRTAIHMPWLQFQSAPEFLLAVR